MRRLALPCAVSFVVAILACSKTEQKATADSGMPMPMMPKISANDVAGTWAVRAMNEKGDSVLTTYDLVATNDTMPWSITYANGTHVALKVLSIAGDSIVMQSAPYESVLRKGVKVTVDAVSRLKDGKLVGTYVAHYDVPTADSVRRGISEGTRKP